jgi:hypothetical protein
MGEREEGPQISRRRLLQKLGLGTAVVAFTPIVTSLGSDALAGTCPPCEAPCTWTCGGVLQVCGGNGCYCSADTDGNCFCWTDGLCSNFSDCTQSSDCPTGYACIPNTCCGVSKCIPGCGMPGRRHGARHGKMASGHVR